MLTINNILSQLATTNSRGCSSCSWLLCHVSSRLPSDLTAVTMLWPMESWSSEVCGTVAGSMIPLVSALKWKTCYFAYYVYRVYVCLYVRACMYSYVRTYPTYVRMFVHTYITYIHILDVRSFAVTSRPRQSETEWRVKKLYSWIGAYRTCTCGNDFPGEPCQQNSGDVHIEQAYDRFLS